VTFFLCAFAAFFTVQTIKMIVSPKLQGEGVARNVFKMFLAGGAAFGTAVLLLPVGDWRACVAYGLAGGGLAVILHKVTRWVSSLGDESFIRFLKNSR
jgi:hypothetical protein